MYNYLFVSLFSIPLGGIAGNGIPRNGITGSYGNCRFHFFEEHCGPIIHEKKLGLREVKWPITCKWPVSELEFHPGCVGHGSLGSYSLSYSPLKGKFPFDPQENSHPLHSGELTSEAAGPHRWTRMGVPHSGKTPDLLEPPLISERGYGRPVTIWWRYHIETPAAYTQF